MTHPTPARILGLSIALMLSAAIAPLAGVSAAEPIRPPEAAVSKQPSSDTPPSQETRSERRKVQPEDRRGTSSEPARPVAGTAAMVLDLTRVGGLVGRDVKSQAGDKIGHIVDVIVSASGAPLAAIVDFGGILGVGSRKVALDWKALAFEKLASDGTVSVDLSRDQIRVAPEYKPGEPIVVLQSQSEAGARSAGPARPEPAKSAEPAKPVLPATPEGAAASGGAASSEPKAPSSAPAGSGDPKKP